MNLTQSANKKFSECLKSGAKILWLCAVNDKNGNPRRLYLETPNNNVNATECRYWEEGYAGYSAITDDILREIIAKDSETNKIRITVEQYEKTKKTWKHG
tara:strand:- start:80 stop:379 length:300 start_codon:yes stop_codon:yes gene_type:complete